MKIKKNAALLGVEKIFYYKIVVALLGVNMLAVLAVVLLREKLPPSLPLWYGSAAGDKQLAAKTLLVLPPFIAMGIVVLGSVITKFLDDTFLKQVVIGIGILSTILASIAVAEIVVLVGNI
jgi:hypothetical protein